MNYTHTHTQFCYAHYTLCFTGISPGTSVLVPPLRTLRRDSLSIHVKNKKKCIHTHTHGLNTLYAGVKMSKK